MPDSIDYDASGRRLLVGRGFVENVAPATWSYEVSGKQVLAQWFSYRRKTRDRPIIGDRYQMHISAIGQVLLAYAPRHIQEEVLSGDLPAFTAHTYTDRETLERVLVDIQRSGYAVSDRQTDLENVAVAAPVRGFDGSVIASVSLAYPPGTGDLRGMGHLIRLTATSISRTLAAAGYGDAAS